MLKSLYRVAKKVSHNKEIKFGISDASKNEYKDFEEKDLSSVTIRLYRGDRGKKEFKKFIIRGNKL